MYLAGGANAAKVFDILCDEETDPEVVSGDIRNCGTARFARDFGGTDGGALTFDCGVCKYSQGFSSGGTGPRNKSC